MQSCPTPPPRQISGCVPTNSTEASLVRALSKCASCGVAQRHEPCHARVVALLDGGGAPNRSFEFAQRKVARVNSSACRRPCQLHTSPDSWASLLAGLSAFARDARPQWSSKQGRDALLREWAAIARQRLEEGWHGAAACRARAAQPRPPTQRFLVLDGGGEQQHKNKWVLLDALYVARVLRLPLVEPHVAHSRLLGTNQSRGSQFALHHYWDLQPICERFDVIPARRFAEGWGADLHSGALSTAVVSPKRGRGFPGGWRLHTEEEVREAFAHTADARVVVLREWWRSLKNEELVDAERGVVPHAGLGPSLAGLTWEPNPGYAHLAALLLRTAVAPDAASKLLAVQWRTEDWEHNVADRAQRYNSSERDSLLRCSIWAARRIRTVMAEHGLTHVFVATDLRTGASSTYYGARRPAAIAALRRLESAVPAARGGHLRAFLNALPDAGVRANLEAAICAQSKLLLTTTSLCDDCAKARRCSKMSSAFGMDLLNTRVAYRRTSRPLF